MNKKKYKIVRNKNKIEVKVWKLKGKPYTKYLEARVKSE